MRIFLKQRNEGMDGGPTITCVMGDCARTTKHGKQYCSDHIDHMSYAQMVVAELSRRDQEAVSLAADSRLPRDSHLVKEAFALLWEYQSLSAPGLTRHIPISHTEAETLLRSLADHGLATIARTSRGVEATCTVGPDDLPIIDTDE